ncbi:MAG: MetQ/NlpA family ABC transporter substrate-binding protein [Deltaproteobacteria bacterium]|jgi:D-methionine transport system substrate-binding protein|nr:MetQ/NlpA family ABC transporter substrate-binding protein [Deltaproteobacteria bacterium]
MNKILAFSLSFVLFLATAAYAQDGITVGTVSGSDVAFLEKAVEVAAKDGLKVTIKEFSDYPQLNPALVSGDIDLNSFQHIPYLDSFLRDNPSDLVSIGTTYIAPMGIYSKRIKSLEELKEGDIVAIPNDPSNGGRALLLLEKAGKITLRPDAGITATPFDVEENPLKLKIIAVDAAQAPTALDDAAAVAINNNYATPLGLNPLNDAIFLEDADSPYVNIIVARGADKDNPQYLQFVKAYQSQEVADLIIATDKGATIPAFPYEKK